MSVVTLLTGLFKKPIEHAAESALETKMKQLKTVNPEVHATLVHAWRAAKPELDKLVSETVTELDDLAVEVVDTAIEASAAEETQSN